MNIISEINKTRTCLMELVGMMQHVECCSPSNVAVQWNLQRLRKSAKDLGTLEVLDALSGCLDLNKRSVWQRETLKFSRTIHIITYLNSQSSDCSNNIKGAT
jgi:hypothetical protein